MADRVTQQVLQVGFQPDPDARVTSVAAEVLIEPTAPTTRVTAIAAEVLHSYVEPGGGGGSSVAIMYIIAS